MGVVRASYDFIIYASFPSSAKMENDGQADWSYWGPSYRVAVTPGASVKVKTKAKQENVVDPSHLSHVGIWGYDGKDWRWLDGVLLPIGSFKWNYFERGITIPADVMAVGIYPAGGRGTPQRVGITWFDDLEAYMDDKLIYRNDFNNWAPIIIPAAELITGATIIKFIE